MQAVIEMETSTGARQSHARTGRCVFPVDGRECVLYLYSRGGPSELFLPFQDATSCKETYGAGRHLDLEVDQNDEVEVDFNLAHNPYCAYNERWTCPIPSVENWLTVPIQAGELVLQTDHERGEWPSSAHLNRAGPPSLDPSVEGSR